MSQPYSSGFIVVPNDDLGMSGVIISSLTGALAALTGDLGRGALGAQLLTGTFAMLHNSGTDISIRIFDTSFATLFTTHLYTNSNASFLGVPLASDTTSTFYMLEYPGTGGATPVIVFSCSSLGVAGTSWTLDIDRDPGGVCMGVSTDNTTLYYANLGSSGGGNQGKPIKRWDLINNLPLGNFVTPEATALWGAELMVIPDTSSFIVVCQPDHAVQNFELRQYSTVNASLIQTVALPFDSSQGSGPRVSLDLGGPESAFWVRTFENSGTSMSNFRQYLTISSTPIANIQVATDSSDPTKVPLSCPFFAWSNNVTPPVPPEPLFVGTAATMPIRRERTVPLPIATGNARQGLARLELRFQPGTGITAGPLGVPKFMLRVSWDNGKTWSNERLMNAGREGAYITRAFCNLLGSGRFPVVQVVTTDTFLPVMTGCDVWLSEGTH